MQQVGILISLFICFSLSSYSQFSDPVQLSLPTPTNAVNLADYDNDGDVDVIVNSGNCTFPAIFELLRPQMIRDIGLS